MQAGARTNCYFLLPGAWDRLLETASLQPRGALMGFNQKTDEIINVVKLSQFHIFMLFQLFMSIRLSKLAASRRGVSVRTALFRAVSREEFDMRATLIVAALAALSFGGMAQAKPAPFESVDVRGLDLNSPADVQILHQRLSQAAARVCARQPQDMYVNTRDRIENCDQPALEAAFKAMPAPMAAALQGRSASIRLAAR